MSVIRPKVLRYITERAGNVVYKDEIMEALDLKSTQVTSSVRGIQLESPIGSEIETVQHGNAWRFRPNRPTAPVTNGHRAVDLERPLTTILKEYFVTHPYAIVHIDQLVEYSGRTEAQVRVGINNMKNGHADIRPYVTRVLDGQAYRYDPPDPSNAPPVLVVPGPTPPLTSMTSTPTPPVRRPVTPVATPGDDTSSRLFEEIGRTDDAIIIRDSDDGALYRATPLT